MTAEFVVGVHVIVLLNHNQTPMTSEAIAENVCTNPARVRKVMQKLKKAGLIERRNIQSGGYIFVKDPEKTTAYDIFKATSRKFVKVKWRSGIPDSECPISRKMAPVIDGMFASLDDRCREELERTSITDIERRIFGQDDSDDEKCRTDLNEAT